MPKVSMYWFVGNVMICRKEFLASFSMSMLLQQKIFWDSFDRPLDCPSAKVAHAVMLILWNSSFPAVLEIHPVLLKPMEFWPLKSVKSLFLLWIPNVPEQFLQTQGVISDQSIPLVVFTKRWCLWLLKPGTLLLKPAFGKPYFFPLWFSRVIWCLLTVPVWPEVPSNPNHLVRLWFVSTLVLKQRFGQFSVMR